MPDIDQNTEYGGGAILNRFAVSALSKKYKDQALNEEIMANKDTGEFLTKSPDGVVMSLDAMNRRRTAIANATEHALMQNMYGKMFEIKIDGLTLPESISYDKNLLSEPLTLKTNLKKILFFIDLDEVLVDSIDGEVVENNPIVTINIVCKSVDGIEEILIERELKKINNEIIDISSNVSFSNNSYTTRIDTISFRKNNSDNVNTVLILQNIIVNLD